ncbi:hypothetical protein L7F22_059765 [Adiantum nelumboides]|nr:hypothetical protein [Adiantum nelumboides]
MTTLCMVLGLIAHENMELSQMDIKTVFLYGDLHENIYMEQSVGHVVKGKEHLVCKLRKSLYRLKQAPREWYHKFDTFMRSQGCMHSEIDHCLYTKRRANGSLQILILYEDNMLITEKDNHNVYALKDKLGDIFDMKNLGDANRILVIRMIRDRSRGLLYLSQQTYVEKVLKRLNMKRRKLGTIQILCSLRPLLL